MASSGCSSSNESVLSRCFYDYATTKSSLPEFSARLFCSADTAGGRVDIYVSVKESGLKFSREENEYYAAYTSGIHVFENQKSAGDQEISRVVRSGSYPGSSDRFYDAFVTSVRLKAGAYSVQIDVFDSLARETATRTYMLKVPDYSSKTVSLSDVLLLARFDTTGGAHRITPFILTNAGLLPDTIKFFSVVSSPRPASDSIVFSMYRLQSQRGPLPFNGLQALSTMPSAYNPCDAREDTILIYRYWVNANLPKGNSYLFGTVPKPAEGEYLLKVGVDSIAGEIAETSLEFQVRNPNFPDITDDLNEMVGAVNYVAMGSEMQKIVAVRTDSAIRANLFDFWKVHGGVAKMTQYYRRVEQANRYFTSCIEGWRTPMGMFYVVCGPPDGVDCQGEWQERWTYSQSNGQNALIILFRLIKDTINPEDRLYRIENVYSNSDMLNYYVTRWRNPD